MRTSFEQVGRPGRRLGLRQRLVRLDRLDQLVADGEQRVQRRQRILEDMADGRAAQLPDALVGGGKQVLVAQHGGAADDAAGRRRHQPHDRHGGDRLAGTGFADEAEAFALLDVEVDAADRLVDLAADVELGAQSAHVQHRAVGSAARGGCASRIDRGARHRARQRARLEARVEHVAHAVAEQIDAHHQREDHQAGDDRDMRRGEQDLAALAEHGAEIGLRRLGAEPEEGQAGGLEDHPADCRRHGDDDDRQHVGQHFGEQDLRHGTCPRGAPRRRIRDARNAERDAADVAGEERDVDDGDGVERVEQARAEHRHDGQRQKDVGKRHQHVDAAHQQRVGAAAGIAGDEADQRAEEGGDQRWPKCRPQG